MRSLGRASSIGGVTRRDRSRGSDIVRQLAAMLAACSDQRSAISGQFVAPGGNPGPHAAGVISTGWDAIDRVLAPASPRAIDSDAIAHIGRGGLQRGVLHEWLGHEESAVLRRRWLPPHSLFIHLAWRAIETDADLSGLIIWIGRRVWPQANVLRGSPKRFTTEAQRHRERLWGIEPATRNASGMRTSRGKFQTISNRKSQIPSFLSVPPCLCGEVFSSPRSNALLSRSLFIDPPDDASRLWAIDLALRSPAASVVIADGSRLKMAESRRLQLAAERGGALTLLARPAWEASELSAAAMRWRVHRTPSPSRAPRWIVELLRCKHGCAVQAPARHGSSVSSGVFYEEAGAMRGAASWGGWEMEYASTGHVRLVADVVDRPGSPGEAAGIVEGRGGRSLSLA